MSGGAGCGPKLVQTSPDGGVEAGTTPITGAGSGGATGADNSGAGGDNGGGNGDNGTAGGAGGDNGTPPGTTGSGAAGGDMTGTGAGGGSPSGAAGSAATGAGGGGLPGSGGAMMVGDACHSVVQQHPDEGKVHIPCTTPTYYMTEPPSSGDHYAVWANYQTFTKPVPWGNLVHSLEHGAIVIVYNCPDGCAADVARIQTLISQVTDPLCSPVRMVLAPDPTLDVRFAASAWTWTLRSDCFDETTFGDFIRAHIGLGLEQICSPGGVTADELCPSP